MPTNDMYKNPPLVNGNIHDVTSPASLADEYDNANIAPNNPANAVANCEQAACQYERPDFSRITKSLISWGTSWTNVAIRVIKPN